VAKLPGKLRKRGLISGGGFFLSQEFSKVTRCTKAPMQSVLEPFPLGDKAALRKPGPSTPPGDEVKMNGAKPLPSHVA
jgi:hypothetical protein